MDCFLRMLNRISQMNFFHQNPMNFIFSQVDSPDKCYLCFEYISFFQQKCTLECGHVYHRTCLYKRNIGCVLCNLNYSSV